jgi:hypothetical protein
MCQLRNCRTLIACIKDLGSHPCPRCFVSTDQIYTLGRNDDRKWREESCRRDDDERRKKVDDARRTLYEEGYAITGDHVDGLLKDESLVTTKVAVPTFTLFWVSPCFLSECILSGVISIRC